MDRIVACANGYLVVQLQHLLEPFTRTVLLPGEGEHGLVLQGVGEQVGPRTRTVRTSGKWRVLLYSGNKGGRGSMDWPFWRHPQSPQVPKLKNI